jgi:hypothetical protein
MLAFVYFIMLPTIQRRSEFEKLYTGKYNLRLLGEKMEAYCKEHDGYLPDADRWCDLLIEHDPNLSKSNFKHPRIEYGACNFAFNKNLSGRRLGKIPGNVVLLFEADGAWNLEGAAELLKVSHNKLNSADFEGARNSSARDVLLVNGTIKTYCVENAGVRGAWRKDIYYPLRWTPD